MRISYRFRSSASETGLSILKMFKFIFFKLDSLERLSFCPISGSDVISADLNMGIFVVFLIFVIDFADDGRGSRLLLLFYFCTSIIKCTVERN